MDPMGISLNSHLVDAGQC